MTVWKAETAVEKMMGRYKVAHSSLADHPYLTPVFVVTLRGCRLKPGPLIGLMG